MPGSFQGGAPSDAPNRSSLFVSNSDNINRLEQRSEEVSTISDCLSEEARKKVDADKRAKAAFWTSDAMKNEVKTWNEGGHNKHREFPIEDDALDYQWSDAFESAEQAQEWLASGDLTAEPAALELNQPDDYEQVERSRRIWLREMYEAILEAPDPNPVGLKKRMVSKHYQTQYRALVGVQKYLTTLSRCRQIEAYNFILFEKVVAMHRRKTIPSRCAEDWYKFGVSINPDRQLICSERLLNIISVLRKNKLSALDVLRDDTDVLYLNPDKALGRKLNVMTGNKAKEEAVKNAKAAGKAKKRSREVDPSDTAEQTRPAKKRRTSKKNNEEQSDHAITKSRPRKPAKKAKSTAHEAAMPLFRLQVLGDEVRSNDQNQTTYVMEGLHDPEHQSDGSGQDNGSLSSADNSESNHPPAVHNDMYPVVPHQTLSHGRVKTPSNSHSIILTQKLTGEHCSGNPGVVGNQSHGDLSNPENSMVQIPYNNYESSLDMNNSGYRSLEPLLQNQNTTNSNLSSQTRCINRSGPVLQNHYAYETLDPTSSQSSDYENRTSYDQANLVDRVVNEEPITSDYAMPIDHEFAQQTMTLDPRLAEQTMQPYSRSGQQTMQPDGLHIQHPTPCVDPRSMSMRQSQYECQSDQSHPGLDYTSGGTTMSNCRNPSQYNSQFQMGYHNTPGGTTIPNGSTPDQYNSQAHTGYHYTIGGMAMSNTSNPHPRTAAAAYNRHNAKPRMQRNGTPPMQQKGMHPMQQNRRSLMQNNARPLVQQNTTTLMQQDATPPTQGYGQNGISQLPQNAVPTMQQNAVSPMQQNAMSPTQDYTLNTTYQLPQNSYNAPNTELQGTQATQQSVRDVRSSVNLPDTIGDYQSSANFGTEKNNLMGDYSDFSADFTDEQLRGLLNVWLEQFDANGQVIFSPENWAASNDTGQ